jgi:hypothetical protein
LHILCDELDVGVLLSHLFYDSFHNRGRFGGRFLAMLLATLLAA